MAYLKPMRPHDLLVPTPAGLCCRPGGFHIDPLRPVDTALITHGHSDHARPGHGAVLATQETLDFMRLRYGDDFAGTTQVVRYGETLDVVSAFQCFGEWLSQRISEEKREKIVRCSIPGAGACGGMYTANTMASAIEALGMSLPYSASIPAEYPEQLDEGFTLRLSPLLTFDGDALDAAIELSSNTVRTLHRTRVSAPSSIGASEITVDVPEVSETRLTQTVKDWPLGQSLLISAGVQPGILQDKNGLFNLRIPGTYPTSTELLIFLEAETATRSRSKT